MKIIDWNAFWLSLAQLLVGLVFLCASDADHVGYRIFGGLIALIGLYQSVHSIKGTVFDEKHVCYTSFMLRKRVVLSEIKAANCEFGVRFTPMLLFVLAGGGSGKRGRRSGSMQLRSYMVNLSGDFGSAQVRFYSKRWRDAFLMELRERSPLCRITRWS